MAINTNDGQFSLDCWVDPDDDSVEPVTEYSDSLPELQARAEQLADASTYSYMIISSWDESKDDWEQLEVYETDDDEEAAA